MFGDINITFTPSRHFSGRSYSSMGKCLWGGWAIKSFKENIWFSGDGGYGKHFEEIGKKLGPFDFGFIECGQYGKEWPQIHLFPNESVQAAIDAKVSVAVPIHWGAFNLSYEHSWHEPADKFIANCKKNSVAYATPEMGKVNYLTEQNNSWWRNFIK